MAHATPQVSGETLTIRVGTEEQCIAVGSPAWWQWLDGEGITTFRFKNQRGTFTARRERKSGGWYWYAYRKHEGKLYKAYLGKSEELAAAQLDAVATALARQVVDRDAERARGTTEGRDQPTERSELPGTRTTGPLLTTKFYQPPARSDLVARPRLIEQLETGARRKLTLISAPAGFGKTTLLSVWQSASRFPHAWLSLDAGDNDPARFWTYVVAALQKLCPQVHEQVMPLLQSLPPPLIEPILTVLINTLAGVSHDIALVLDDYHVITTQSMHDAMAFLLEHLPLHVHLVIASRSEPPLSLIRLRAQGQLNELHAADLRFTPGEVVEFLNQVMRLNLSRDEIAALDTHTEGWIAGLQLAALSMRGRQNAGNIIATFTGSHRYIMDYLTGEVLQRQQEHIREFLLQTSILDRLSASLCNAITGRSDAQALLEQLEQENLFLIPLDEQRQWYRYHQLFAEFLQDRLRQMHPDLLPRLHLRASEWYRQHGLISATVGHAFEAEDSERVAEFIEQFAPTMLMRSEVTTLLQWLKELPEEILHARPRLQLYLAGSLVAIGQLDAAEAYLRDVERYIRPEQAVGDESEGNQTRLEGEFFSVSASLAAFRGDLPRTIEHAQKALALLPPEDKFTRGLIAASLGTAYIFSGEMAKADEAFSEAIAMGQVSQDRHAVLASIAGQGYLQAARGQLHQAAETQRYAIRLGTRQGGRMFSAAGLAYVCLSDVLCEWNELDAAERYAREGIEVGKRWGYVGVLGQGYCVLAHVQLARGNSAEALALMQQVEQQLREYTFPNFTRMVTSYHAWIQLKTGNVEAAAQWAHSCGLSEHDTFSYPRELEHITLIQIRIAQGKLADASRIIERLLPAAEGAGRMQTAIYCLILQAIILQQQSQQERAIAPLARALSLAEPEGYIRIFIDQGKPLITLLHLAGARGMSTSYVQKLLSVAGATAIVSVLPHESSLLSERELSVLRQIAVGKSNQEIAREFVIALSTIKTHLNNIYTKLGVHSRTQAIARAKELHLLT